MRKFVLVASIVFSNVATAGAASVPTQEFPVSSIITPNVATGYLIIGNVRVEPNGDMAVGCQSYEGGPQILIQDFRECDITRRRRPFSAFVPAGKQYVGFTPWLDGRVIIFWK